MSYYFNTLITGVSSIDEIKNRIVLFNEENNTEETSVIPKLDFKEDDNLMIIFSDNNHRSSNQLDNSIKSLIIDKTTLKPITTQFNKLIYNQEAVDFLKDKNWNDIKIKYCYEGTMILVFYAYEHWYVCTRKCLDAKKSYWIKDYSYYDLFMDSIDGKFKLDDLNKNYCYHFILLHYKNRNIVDYSRLGKHYKNVVLAMTTEKNTFSIIPYEINDKIIYPRIVSFNNLSEVMKDLDDISDGDKNTSHISTEGFIIEYYEDNCLTLLKLQTNIYQYISNMKPNVSNLEAMFLELYQKDQLREIIPYFSTHCGETINRINKSMKTITTELLNIYHQTRSHKNESLYDLLPSSYKCALYIIHGQYLQKKTKETNNENDLNDKKTITVYDIYEILKKMDSFNLRKIFVDRIKLINNESVKEIFNSDCFFTLLEGKLLS
jgi:hypothetical protein